MFKNWTWMQWLILIGGITIVILGGFVIYILLQEDAFIPTQPPSIPSEIGELPSLIPGAPQLPPSPVEQIPLSQIQGLDFDDEPDLIAQGGLTQVQSLSEFPVNFITASSANDFIFYDEDSSRFYRIDSDGVVTQIGQRVFANVENVTFADNSEDAILEFPDGSNILYNFENNEQLTLPKHWEDFDFSPDSDSIAFKSLAQDVDERWLAVTDRSGGRTRLIEPLGNNEDIVNVDWSPNNQVVATYTEPEGLSTTELYFVGFNRENFRLSKVNGVKPDVKWNTDGSRLMINASQQNTGFRPVLTVRDGSGSSMGQNRQEISLQTWVDKCTFRSSSEMICGVPTELPEGAGLIPSVADSIPDEIFTVNVNTGAVSKLATPDVNVNVEKLLISEDGNTLVIQDRLTNTIKKINLN